MCPFFTLVTTLVMVTDVQLPIIFISVSRLTMLYTKSITLILQLIPPRTCMVHVLGGISCASLGCTVGGCPCCLLHWCDSSTGYDSAPARAAADCSFPPSTLYTQGRRRLVSSPAPNPEIQQLQHAVCVTQQKPAIILIIYVTCVTVLSPLPQADSRVLSSSIYIAYISNGAIQ